MVGFCAPNNSSRELMSQGDMCYKQWSGKLISDQSCRDVLYELLVRLWCVKVNGKVCRDIYASPRPPKVSNPVFDEHLPPSRIPKEVMKLLPSENVLLAIYIEYEGNN